MRNILIGNGLLVVCSVFYLAWWIIAFHPTKAVKGAASGWLLLPAVIAGMGAIYLLINAMWKAEVSRQLFPNLALLLIGIAAYFILLAVTGLVLHRVVTTELFLIIGWSVLALAEINTMYGLGAFGLAESFLWMIIIIIAAVISMICYLKFYDLKAMAGYVDGMIPLILIGVLMLVLMIRGAVHK